MAPCYSGPGETMAKKSKATAATPVAGTPRASIGIGPLATVLLVAFTSSLLALYQWMELLVARAGGDLACSINSALDCAPVWSSSFAMAVGEKTGVPVAGWGLAWSLAAFAAAFWAWVQALRAPDDVRPHHAVRALALGGVLATIVLFTVSIGVGVLCPTCLATYALAIAYAVGALRLPGPVVPVAADGLRAIGAAVALVVVAYLLLLIPASGLPTAPADALKNAIDASKRPTEGRDAGGAPETKASQQPQAFPSPGAEEGPVAAFLRSLDPQSRQLVADGLYGYRTAKTVPAASKVRFVKGPASARVSMVEWTDIKCGHCAQFATSLKEMLASLPPDAVKVEPRHFPLDKECNEVVPQSDGSGTRCAAARALICLEGKEDFWSVQLQMFDEQRTLDRDRVIALAAPAAGGKAALERCMASPDTEAKLREDIAYGMSADLHGTPLVLVNGKEAMPVGPFLYALILAGGDASHPAFTVLPPPRPRQPHVH